MILIAIFYLEQHFIERAECPYCFCVKNILESHASYLMSGKELSKLVALVKGTQFDLVVRLYSWYLVAFYWKNVLYLFTKSLLQEYLQ